MAKFKPTCHDIARWSIWGIDHIIKSDRHDRYTNQYKLRGDDASQCKPRGDDASQCKLRGDDAS